MPFVISVLQGLGEVRVTLTQVYTSLEEGWLMGGETQPHPTPPPRWRTCTLICSQLQGGLLSRS